VKIPALTCIAFLSLGLSILLPRAEAQTATVTVLDQFGVLNSGLDPQGPLILGSDGNFYGTTTYGSTVYGVGDNFGYGTVFKMTPAGVVTTLHSFIDTDGYAPTAGVIQGSDGNLYGTAAAGGLPGNGTIFKVTTAGVFTRLYSFSALNGSHENGDGAKPAGLIQGTDGNFYGTASAGGVSGDGTVFKITPGGVLTRIHSFSGTDGSAPTPGMIQGKDGNFYGTTLTGGLHGDGTLFKLTPGGLFTTLYSFTGGTGKSPEAGVVQGSDGNFYGTTSAGGTNNTGTVFQYSAAGVFTSLYSFTALYEGSNEEENNDDGAAPSTGLVESESVPGTFFGTAPHGGLGSGTVFEITSAGAFSHVYTFNYVNAPSGLVEGSDGNFYGTTAAALSSPSVGTAFKVTPSGEFTSLHSFGFSSADGLDVMAPLVQGSDGTFYGTSYGGGAYGYGTVFAVTSDGMLTTLYSFTGGSDGESPEYGLVEASDGNFYGTTEFAGAAGSSGYGTIFRITPAGELTTLYSFSPLTNRENVTGAEPSYLTLGSDGNLYGVARLGGANGNGTVFKITTSGTFTRLYTFSALNSSSENGDGSLPTGLVQATDGNFYGTAVLGGPKDHGTVFKITPGGVLTRLYGFTGTDGSLPQPGLIQGSDGLLYGTTDSGGTDGYGSVFKVTLTGKLTTLYSFDNMSNGSRPPAGLVEGSNGNFYGTTTSGTSYGDGTLFEITSSGTYSLLHTFTGTAGLGGTNDGAAPYSGLIQGSNGNFYGTTASGGDTGGTVFELTLTNGD
jgi:uncharacterized repeat protein (TIGR03803 family)